MIEAREMSAVLDAMPMTIETVDDGVVAVFFDDRRYRFLPDEAREFAMHLVELAEMADFSTEAS